MDSIKIEKVHKENWTQLEKLFSGSKECLDCWCMNHRSQPSSCPTGDKAKSALKNVLLSKSAYGLLAFFNGEPVGWCAFDPVETQIGHDYCLQNKIFHQPNAWMIHCLFIDQKYRSKGISRELISAAVIESKKNMASEVVSFPIPAESEGKFPKEVAEFSGRLSTFLKLGFTVRGKIDDFYQVVGKVL